MAEATDFYKKNPIKSLLFIPTSFLKATKVVLKGLIEIYTRHSSVEHASFKSFMAVKSAADAGLVEVCKGAVSKQHKPARLRSVTQVKMMGKKAAICHTPLTTGAKKSLVPCLQGARMVRQVISAPKTPSKLHLKWWKGGANCCRKMLVTEVKTRPTMMLYSSSHSRILKRLSQLKNRGHWKARRIRRLSVCSTSFRTRRMWSITTRCCWGCTAPKGSHDPLP